jgi:hypothetical protein
MPPYRAQLGGFLGGGTPAPVGHTIDYAGLIDAAAGGAGTLIREAYQRKLAARQQDRADQQLQLERDREERQRDHEARMELASGIIRGGASIERLPEPSAEPVAPTIAGALSRRFDSSGGAMPQPDAPAPAPDLAPGSLGSIPRIRVVDTPDRYDPDQDRTRVRALDAIGARGGETRRTEEVRQQGRVDRDAARHTFKLEEIADKAARDAERSAAHDSRVTARVGAGGAGRPLTANGKEVAKRTLLDGLVGYHKDEAGLRQYLSGDDVGKSSVEKYGITDADIAAALGRAQAKTESRDFAASTGFQRSTFDTPEGAATKVAKTHATIGKPKPAKAPAAAAAAAAATPKIDPASVTDDEAAAAYAAGKRTDDEILSHVAQARGKKK